MKAASALVALACTLGFAIGARGDKPKLKSLWSGDPEKAVALFSEAVAANPLDADAQTNLGQALARLHRREPAEAAFRRAIALAPARYAAWARLGDLLADDPHRWQRRDEIVALLKTGLERVAGDAAGVTDVTLSLANFERSIGRTEAARALLAALDGALLSPEQRKRVLDLDDDLAVEERARRLRDLPEESVSGTMRREMTAVEEQLARGEMEASLLAAGALSLRHPSWRAPRWLRARTFEALGRWDDAERELTVLLRIAPSHAEAWRRLGRILAVHGGALDADRADEALRQALALEPAWWDLWILRARVAVRAGRLAEASAALNRYLGEAPARGGDPEVRQLVAATHSHAAAGAAAPSLSRRAEPPTPRARALYREAEQWLAVGDPLGSAPGLLTSALAESPAYLDAAVAAFATIGRVPEPTVTALWDDGEALLELSRKVRALGRDAAARALARPWLDRAVVLGVIEARIERALSYVEASDPARAQADLIAYATSGPQPGHLDEARLLLASISDGARQDLGGGAIGLGAAVQARARLLSDQPGEAAELLGGRCDRTTSDEQLVPLGRVLEWSGDTARAIACYREALRRNGNAPAPLSRLAGIAARATDATLRGLEPEVRRAAAQKIVSANWALARLQLARGDTDGALVNMQLFLKAPGSDDEPNRPAVRAALDRLVGERDRARREAATRRWAGGIAGGVVLALLIVWLLGGATLAGALGRCPALFPEVARAVAELRHDVLKHRTSVLGLLVAGSASRDEVARMLWEPQRASALITAAYQRLRREARARGVTLRRLAGEPTLGPLVRDLRRAERLVKRAAPTSALRPIDTRLREVHSERLAALLELGPRTQVDAKLVSGWIRDLEAEWTVRGRVFTAPALLLPRLPLDFPVESSALSTIFANLLRNAEAAVEGDSEPRSIRVRIDEERDLTGRRQVVLLVADSAPSPLTVEMIEAQESGRGLAIVRDLVHEWRGRLLVEPEEPPRNKGVGACFPT